MRFDPFAIDLPVTGILLRVQELLAGQNTLIVSAPPGAGKSTLLPLALLDSPWLAGKKIVMLEPRRLATRAVASRMATLLNEPVGKTIGYRIRFESITGPDTRLEVVTEGILTRLLQQDNALEEIGLVIFDEFHERNLHGDVGLTLCREVQHILRPDLRLLVMSATIDIPRITSFLNCPIVESEGRQFPVHIQYSDEDVAAPLLPEAAARTAAALVKAHEGDVLIFLPGEAEIRKCEELAQKGFEGFSIHPLYSQLPPQEQALAIFPNKSGRRKIIIATSIAETSLTIEGVRIVVDGGFGRRSRFDPRSGLSRSETYRIAKDSADQRAGRAGRLSSGLCHRMWTAATDARLAPNRLPEILEADLCNMLLDIAALGMGSVAKLQWLTPPPPPALSQAEDTLQHIGALENGHLTAHGRQIQKLACHPRLAHMLLMAARGSGQALATDICALLEERDPLPKETGADINLRIEALRRARRARQLNGPLGRIEKNAAFYRGILKVEADNGAVNAYSTGLLLAYAYPERIAIAKSGSNNNQFQLANGRAALINREDSLAHESWLSIANMDLRDGMGRIFLASALDPEDVAHLARAQQSIAWDSRKGAIVAANELRIGTIVLQATPLSNPAEEAITPIISKVISMEGELLLDFNDEMIQLQNRILSLRIWNPAEDWPDVSTAGLLKDLTWLQPHLKGLKKSEDFKRIGLAEALLNTFEWEKRQLLETLAPVRLTVPSGSKIPLQYFPNGNVPVLSVRLQEVFGLADTPAVNRGKSAVLLHLLSPGYKLVQATADLRSFWKNLYFETKKELQRRYPKHAWPDDPWAAKPVAKGQSWKK